MAPSNVSLTLGANVRAEMARRGISQTTLATRLGISQGQLSRRLRGVIAMDVDEIHVIADFLGVPVTRLLESADLESVA